MRIRQRVRRAITSQGFAIVLLSLMMLVILILVIVEKADWIGYWLSTPLEWLSEGESGSATIRNLGLVLAGLIALPLAIWRSMVAQRQAKTAQHSLLHERYQKGSEMLGSQVLAVRLGGIYALLWLATEHPREYIVQIILLLCAFVRHPTKDDEIDALRVKTGELSEMRPDVEEAMSVINLQRRTIRGASSINLRGADLQQLRFSEADLSKAYLREANLSGADLASATLDYADLSGAHLRCADLSYANLRRAILQNADLSDAKLQRANLSGVWLKDANLSGTDFCGPEPDQYPEPATGLTQLKLDEARADPDNPPKLDAVLDAQTGEPLAWRGKSLSGSP